MKFKKIWDFIWNEDSLASWIVNIVIAFILVKFIIYPGLGWALGTQFPIVAVVSGSMEHSMNFNSWWENNKGFYENYNISKDEFSNYKFKNGFNKGDIMILFRANGLGIGDTIVFQGTAKDPIIHRIIKLNEDSTFQTKGDNNPDSRSDEKHITKQSVYGKAIIRVPFLGWLKIIFVSFISLFLI